MIIIAGIDGGYYMFIARILQLLPLLEKKSYFLLGPRQTGKSLLIDHTLKKHPIFSLLDSSLYQSLSRHPQGLRELCKPHKGKVVIVDEIQLLPVLLNEVHYLIEHDKIRFLLTGSSARKLKRSGVNLLGGRARVKYLHPFTYPELKEEFDLIKALNRGLLPSIYFSEDYAEDLRAYCGLYLKEEIAAEALTRNIPGFSRFLHVAALCNGEIINYTKIASDVELSRTTTQEYFQILRDTFIGYDLPAWKRTKSRKALTTAKFYLFDVGVAGSLARQGKIEVGSMAFGKAFEHYIFHELKSYLHYKQHDDIALSYWRSTSGFEVDFILADQIAIEVKGKTHISKDDLKGITALKEENLLKRYIVVGLESYPREVNGIEILPWKIFLDLVWSDSLVSE